MKLDAFLIPRLRKIVQYHCQFHESDGWWSVEARIFGLKSDRFNVEFGRDDPLDETRSHAEEKAFQSILPGLLAIVTTAQPDKMEVGKRYLTQAGDVVRIVEISNRGTPYECVRGDDRSEDCPDGAWRYNRLESDFGRVCGSDHDFSDPRNIVAVLLEEEVAA